ncbi:MAG: NAD(P)-binding domain-containing protein [Candidatus Kapabacteria bacterium]|nr:NAD(P)-binding domain-containing protein [Candidatus Kapabacteria bacterium]
MILTIIGSGNVGGALAQRLIAAGHTVLIGARSPLSAKSITLAGHIGEDRFTTVESALAQSEAVILTIPPDAVLHLIPALQTASHNVVIDATNAVRVRPEPYPTAFHAVKDAGIADVVKCFNTTGFENMMNPVYPGGALDMFMAGDSSKAKAVAHTLALDCGFGDCWDFGGGDKVELLEKFALAWINLAIMQGHGRDIGFRVKRR